MRTLFFSITSSLIVASMHAGPIRDMATSSPEQVDQIITMSNYSDLLSFINSAYEESLGESDGITQYVYLLALSKASSDKQIGLALDFSLVKPIMSLKASGASIITNAIINGETIDSTRQSQIKAKLKSELEVLSGNTSGAYEFAQKAATALIVSGDDAGLDVFLTDKKTVQNFQLKDQWDSKSPEELFLELKNSYAQKALSSGKDWDKIMAATYELCRARRAAGIEVKPLQPLINLQNLSR